MFRLFTALAALSLFTPVALAEGPAPAAEEAPAPEGVKAPAWLTGDWKPVFPEEVRKQFDALKLAFRDPPPTEEEIEALPDDTKMIVGMMRMAIEQNPDDPELVKSREMLGQLDKMKVTFGAEGAFKMNIGPEQIDSQYRVLNVKGKVARIAVKDEDGGWTENDVHQLEENKLELRKDGEEEALVLIR